MSVLRRPLNEVVRGWLGIGIQGLSPELAAGFAGAVRETELVASAVVDAWSRIARTSAVVGHADTLALPPKG